ncbi:hypothetical protein QBC33DRAFT_614651 [Phialemonium atrogriseum]|uniref:Uncharacterized protein n=1 Tax=Phialemonium atrogriseum TaxID=1093897 RepID=A0AAJ0BPP9_9PEZI|nr:uncharacterized protein QBC33DRAFT_614651 [Phialemonium atrogriseum]KAK1761920.1 hypothetical protein QBC33DRAFT_614651 [Phialemonium atrogriseum]
MPKLPPGHFWPTPPNSEPSISRPSSRSQRSEQTASGSSTRGQFGISNVKYRVGAPPLRPLPLETGFTEDCARAEIILDKAQIADAEVDFVARHVPQELWTAQPTIFIVAPWGEDSRDKWEAVIKELKGYVDRKLDDIGWRGVDIGVEMVAPQLTMWKYMAPIVNPVLESDWPTIQASIYEILESFAATKSHMTTISLLRLGYSPIRHQNPETVYVSVDYESREVTWPPVVQRIEAYLATLNHHLCLHLENNIVQNLPFQPLEPTEGAVPAKDTGLDRDYQRQVNLGDDIGMALYVIRKDGKRCNGGCGTLGCYLEIKTKSDQGSWKKVALTNYHVVRSAIPGFSLKPKNTVQALPGTSAVIDQAVAITAIDVPIISSELSESDKRGFFLSTATNFTPVESPSRRNHNFNIHQLQKRIDVLTKNADARGLQAVAAATAPLTQNLASKVSFFNSGRQHLGTLFAGSGFTRRTSENHRLDWALIDVVPGRQGDNMLPVEAKWVAEYSDMTHCPLPTGCGIPLRPKQQGRSLKDVTPGEILFKVGMKTGVSAGYFSHVKSNCWLEDDKHMGMPRSSEYLFLGHEGKPFGDHGDSGSVVYDAEGQVLGLLFTGLSPQQTNAGHTFVTPIEDVFEDVIKFSKGGITDIRIAV